MFPKQQLYNDRYNLILNLYLTYDVTIISAVCFCHDLMATEKLSEIVLMGSLSYVR